MNNLNRLGVDIGGTDIKFAVVSGEQIIYKNCISTPDSTDEIVAIIASEANRLKNSHGITSVGVGTPGIIKNGRVTAVNLDFEDTPLEQLLGDATSLPVMVDNDANCAALGEVEFGTAKHCDNIVLLTLGTGVGGGIILNRQICRDHRSELGHMIIFADGGLPCPCGQSGCLEQYASVSALSRNAVAAARQHKGSLLNQRYLADGKINGRNFFAVLHGGCPVARQVLDSYLRYLAVGVKSLINIFGPDAIILAGGITNEGDALLAPLKTLIGPTDVEILISSLQNDAGALGAAALHK